VPFRGPSNAKPNQPNFQLTLAPGSRKVLPVQAAAAEAKARGQRGICTVPPHGTIARGTVVEGLLRLSRGIDYVNDRFGEMANWLVLLACLISAGNAASRYLFSASSNAWLEVQWYMFAGMVLLGGPYTLKVNEHVRVDLFYSAVSERVRIWIDIIGCLLFLLPICVILVYFTWPWFLDSWHIGETSSNAGGLIRWPVKLILPLGFALMALQGISELIKRIEALIHHHRLQFDYEKPLQ
jgi:TRAP-type mannitol/chloroaromatic compound transport system permease small subunit